MLPYKRSCFAYSSPRASASPNTPFASVRTCPGLSRTATNPTLRVLEPEDRLSRLAVLADRDDAGDIDEAAGGLAAGLLLLSSHASMMGRGRLGRQAS